MMHYKVQTLIIESFAMIQYNKTVTSSRFYNLGQFSARSSAQEEKKERGDVGASS